MWWKGWWLNSGFCDSVPVGWTPPGAPSPLSGLLWSLFRRAARGGPRRVPTPVTGLAPQHGSSAEPRESYAPAWARPAEPGTSGRPAPRPRRSRRHPPQPSRRLPRPLPRGGPRPAVPRRPKPARVWVPPSSPRPLRTRRAVPCAGPRGRRPPTRRRPDGPPLSQRNRSGGLSLRSGTISV